MRTKLLLSSAAALAALALTACGDSDSDEEAEKSVTPAVAAKEAEATATALSAALVTYKGGDKAAAEEQVAEAYLQHFELVEGPLEKADHELTEKLEDAIAEDLRDDMKAGKPAAEIETAVNAILADLDKAEAALR